MSDFSVEDLKPGMWVKLMNGLEGVVIPTMRGLQVIGRSSRISTSDSRMAIYCNCRLATNHGGGDGWDIVEVRGLAPHNGEDFFCKGKRELIWKLEDVKEMTITEIENLLGHKIKIVNEK
ncbi:MAG: hypothetical protein ACI4VC_05840 [Clostridia bacterium]